MASNDFTIDKVEYQSVFKVFDRENKGEIHIDQVNHFIQMFEEIQFAPPEEVLADKNGQRSTQAQAQNTQGKQSRQLQHGASTLSSSNQATSQQNGVSRLTNKTKQLQSQNSMGVAVGSTQSPTKRGSNASTIQGFGVGSHSHFGAASNFFNSGANDKGASTKEPNSGGQPSNSNANKFVRPIQASHQNGGAGGGQRSGATNGARADAGPNNMNFINNSGVNTDSSNAGAGAVAKSKNNSSLNNSEDIVGAGLAQSGNTQPATAGSSLQSSTQAQPLQGPGQVPCFPNGSQSLEFEEFIEIISDSCTDPESAENYLVFAFSMFDREKKGYINASDLKCVFLLLGETVSDEEIQTMIKIAGTKSNDKINFKEFVDFFYKVD